MATPGAALPPPAAASEADAAPCEIGDGALVSQLQTAVARVLPAIEMESAGRALGALTGTLRELNGLLRERQAAAAGAAAGRPGDFDDDMPEDIDAFRFELARRINAFVASRTQAAGSDAAGSDAPGSDALPPPGDAQSDSAPPAQPRVRSL